jgi:predicted aconitase
MYQPKMSLTDEEKGILEGKEGATKAKMMECLVRYGDVFGAKRLVPLTYKEGHFVTSFGINMLTPVYPLMDEIIGAGLKCPEGFTCNPRPLDYANVKVGPLERLVFDRFMYGEQAHYESQLAKIGLKGPDAFTCACYLPQVGNTPKEGDVLSWAESSAVVFANSVLGARCNRNSGILEMFGTILGKAPEFGFVTDEGRKASWRVLVRTSKKPEAQVLGSAIGMKVMEAVPYVEGLEKYLKPLPNEDTVAYLKDFGAATASNGAVGLYHIAGITPEAKRLGNALLRPDAKTYVIDDAELRRVEESYPIMWKKRSAKPHKCFIGCPHLTLKQLNDWTDRLTAALKESGRRKLAVYTVFTTAPAVAEAFKKTPKYQEFIKTGAHLSSICPLMYTNNPIAGTKPLMTTSNKLRTYSQARYYKDDEALAIIAGKEQTR